MDLDFKNENIIDGVEKTSIKKRYTGWTTLLILWVLIISSLAIGIRSDFYIGLGVLVIATIIQYFNTKIGNVFTLLILILGTFHIVLFSFLTFSFTFGLKPLFMINLELIIFALLIIHIMKNKLIKIPKKTKQQKEEDSQASINRFKKSFATRSKKRFRIFI